MLIADLIITGFLFIAGFVLQYWENRTNRHHRNEGEKV